MIKTIMVVDDDGDIRDAVRQILQDEGYGVITAGNGLEAMEQLRTAATLPDLILLDLGMPIMNGWDFRAEQRKEPRLAGIPVVVITAAGDSQEKARSLDPAGVLAKPFQLATLMSTVRRY